MNLSELTTIGLGGPARELRNCQSADDFRLAHATAKDAGLPFVVLAGGSNVIFSDQGFPGIVAQVGLRGLEFHDVSGGVLVRARAGERLDDLVHACVGRGLVGMECLAGIPGSVGAVPIQNVGAYGQEAATVIQSVRVLDLHRGSEYDLDAAQCRFAYRSSRFKFGPDVGRFVILSVDLLLSPDGDVTLNYAELRDRLRADSAYENAARLERIAMVRRAVLELRRGKSMVVDRQDPESRSCGSFFTNPIISTEQFAALQKDHPELRGYAGTAGVKVSAAWLVEASGFHKGTTRGGVAVSKRHSLALVNHSGTTAELIALAQEVAGAVERRFGIQLAREPQLFGGDGRLMPDR